MCLTVGDTVSPTCTQKYELFRAYGTLLHSKLFAATFSYAKFAEMFIRFS